MTHLLRALNISMVTRMLNDMVLAFVIIMLLAPKSVSQVYAPIDPEHE